MNNNNKYTNINPVFAVIRFVAGDRQYVDEFCFVLLRSRSDDHLRVPRRLGAGARRHASDAAHHRRRYCPGLHEHRVREAEPRTDVVQWTGRYFGRPYTGELVFVHTKIDRTTLLMLKLLK